MEADDERATEEEEPAGGPGDLASTWRDGRRMVATRADRLVARPVEWRWRRRLPRGKLVILAGDPGLGKSYVLVEVHARWSTGARWPDEPTTRTAMHSIILSAEDGAEDTIKLRLDGQGAEGARVHVVQAIETRAGGPTIVSLERDLLHLEELVGATGATLVSIDPINAYLPVRDSYKDNDIRQALAPLVLFAARTGVTGILVMHLSKDTERQALYRVLGGVGYAATVRVVLMVAKDPRSPGRKYFVNPKNNVAPKALPLAFAIEERPGDRSALVWEPEPVARARCRGRRPRGPARPGRAQGARGSGSGPGLPPGDARRWHPVGGGRAPGRHAQRLVPDYPVQGQVRPPRPGRQGWPARHA